MPEKKVDLPIISKHISWEDINAHCKSRLLRVDNFAEFATIENNKVKAISLTLPYGILTVTCLEMNLQFSLWVTHKIDFLNLWKAQAYQNNLTEYHKLLQERIIRFETKTGKQVDEVREIHAWLQNAQRPEILVGDFTSKRRWFLKLPGSLLPMIYVWICPEGYLQRVVSDNWAPLSGELYFEALRPLAKWEPEI